jgi:DNA uptake protein ComE-like DNA-binding protein
MFWHDFFYFSKGERRALILLLCIVAIAGILLIKKDDSVQPEKPVVGQTESDTVNNVQNNTANQLSGALSPAPGSVAGRSPASSEKSSGRPATSQRKSEKTKYTADRTTTSPENKKETVSERVQRITSYSRPSYVRTEKFEKGTVVELNTADTTTLKKVPGIGSAYAKRIVGYRNLLGGYYSVIQLSEVYGIDEERYNALAPWFTADTAQISKLPVNQLSQDSLRRHPYINYNQAKIITQLRRQKGKITGWENLQLLDEFKAIDVFRLQYYLSFE